MFWSPKKPLWKQEGGTFSSACHSRNNCLSVSPGQLREEVFLLRNQAIRLVSHDTKLPSEVLVVHQSYWKTASSRYSELAYVNKPVPAAWG